MDFDFKVSLPSEFIDNRILYTKIIEDTGTYLYRMDLISSDLPTLVQYRVFTISPTKTYTKIPDGLVYRSFGLAYSEYLRVLDIDDTRDDVVLSL